MTSGDSPSNITVLKVLGCAALIFLVAIGGCMLFMHRSIYNKYTNISADELSQRLSTQLPPDARVLNSVGFSMMHTLLWAKIEMPHREVKPFLNSLSGNHVTAISRTKRLKSVMAPSPDRHYKRIDWWTPDKVGNFISARFATPWGSGGHEIVLLVDLDDPDRAIIYLSYDHD